MFYYRKKIYHDENIVLLLDESLICSFYSESVSLVNRRQYFCMLHSLIIGGTTFDRFINVGVNSGHGNTILKETVCQMSFDRCFRDLKLP